MKGLKKEKDFSPKDVYFLLCFCFRPQGGQSGLEKPLKLLFMVLSHIAIKIILFGCGSGCAFHRRKSKKNNKTTTCVLIFLILFLLKFLYCLVCSFIVYGRIL